MESVEKKSKPKSKEYPAYTLNQSVDFVSKFKDYPFGKPIAYDVAAKALNVSADTKSFRYMISSARQYGLLSTASGKTLSLLEPARRLIRPTESEQAISALKLECFASPKVYGELINQYKGQSVPPINTLINILVTYHGILANVAKTAAQTFLDTANEVGAIKNGVLNMDEAFADEGDSDEAPVDQIIDSLGSQIPKQELTDKDGFDAPLSIPFGEQKKALLYMPLNVEKEDAEYALAMIKLMFKKVYGVTKE